MRLVKKTVNQDDTSAYHLFYADGQATPGTDLTFFDWPTGRESRGTGSVARTGLRVSGEANLAWWRDHLPVTPELASAVDGRPVLLVVDASSSMWPVTLAAAALREAGARRVLPLVIHRRVG